MATIAIAGATGFVGSALIEELCLNHKIIALTRATPEDVPFHANVDWRVCELFSLRQVEDALEGVEIVIYLIHSMLPAAKLMQGSFSDCDLMIADNFARACYKRGVKRIIYLGGLIPPTKDLSLHLESRKEVESALGSWKTPVTVFRAGIVLGSKGSSFQILYMIIKKLPLILCPPWTASHTQPIELSGMLKLFDYAIKHEETTSQVYDVGGSAVLTYLDLMKSLAKEMKLKRFFLPVPFFSIRFSKYSIEALTGASPNLVTPLVESMRHDMVVSHNDLVRIAGIKRNSLQETLQFCIQNIKPMLRKTNKRRLQALKSSNDVLSIQRLKLPQNKSALWVANEYVKWLGSSLKFLVQVANPEEGKVVFSFPFIKKPLLILELSKESSSSDRQLFYIVGGILVSTVGLGSGRLEFREVLGSRYLLAAIHGFRPRLPWFIYNFTQARIHLWVMRAFARHLNKVDSAPLTELSSM